MLPVGGQQKNVKKKPRFSITFTLQRIEMKKLRETRSGEMNSSCEYSNRVAGNDKLLARIQVTAKTGS